MGKPYELELAQLAKTFDWAAAAKVDELCSAVGVAASLPMLSVGSGGSLTAANLLASAQRLYAGQVAAVVTPLDATTMRGSGALSWWVLSAGGSNVDIATAFSAAVRNEPTQLVVICGRRESKLARAALDRHAMVDYIDAEGPTGKDGFLATNSLLGFALLISRAFSVVYADNGLNLKELRRFAFDDANAWSGWLGEATRLWQRDTLIVLCSASTACGAIDLESKFTEAALGHVQVADYRNFAHGRHHWLAKRGGTSAVLALTTEEDRALATRTLALLPKSVPVLRVDLPGGFLQTSILSLLLALRLVGAAGSARGIDPGRPGVPEFGRRLFNLRASRTKATQTPTLSDRDAAAIERKAGISIIALKRRGDLPHWQDALVRFKDQLQDTRYFAGVFDYDGTLVDSKDRFYPPGIHVAREMVRLLTGGFIIGIATGRGPSVRRDLQRCIPTTLWRNVVIGYYNGAEVSTLDDDGCPENTPVLRPELKPLGGALRSHPELQAIATQTDRPYQITLEQRHRAPDDRLWDIVNQVTQTLAQSGISVVRSSHSIDILAPSVSKYAVIEKITSMTLAGPSAHILCIGDRGRWPGNDFVLLRGSCSLSVDEVSVDSATCWNLAPRGVVGSEAMLEHLRSLKKVGNAAKWRYVLRAQ